MDVGYPPSAVVRKEVREEAGLEVTPLNLISVTDSFESGFYRNAHIYNLLFYCQVVRQEPKPQTPEILEAAFLRRISSPSRFARMARPGLSGLLPGIGKANA